MRLRSALARTAAGRAQVVAARADEAMALKDLRACGLSWWAVATRLAPISDRRHMARMLRQHGWRLGVTARDAKRTAVHRNSPLSLGCVASAQSSSGKEDRAMPDQDRLVRRTTTVEEFEEVGDIEMGDADQDDEDEDEDNEDDGETSAGRPGAEASSVP